MSNENFYIAARRVQHMMQPIADIIYHMEADRAALSQMRRVWQFLALHVQEWEEDRHKGIVWDARAPMAPPLPPAAARALTEAVVKRRVDCTHPALVLAYILDFRFYWEDQHKVFRPDSGWLQADGTEHRRVKELVERMAGGAGKVEFAKLVIYGITDRVINGVTRGASVDENGWQIAGKLEDVKLAWLVLADEFPELSKIAGRLLSLHCTSCSVERLWSVLRNVKRDNRTRLGAEKTKKLIMVGADERLRHAQGQEGTAEYLLECLLDF